MRSSRTFCAQIVFIAVLLLPTVAIGQDGQTDAFARQVRPLLKTYCVDCHSGDAPEADLNLKNVAGSQQVLEDRRRWLKVLQKVRFEEMPPADSDQPSRAERKLLGAWIDSAVNSFDCGESPNPGRPTIRRLNRLEYRNTIRDLLGVDYAPADDFPADDVGYGFDNIGDVLSLPPILLEKYLAAATAITGDAIVSDIPPPVAERIPAAKMQARDRGSRDGSRKLTTSGEMSIEFDFPQAGTYDIRISAHGDQAGDEPVKMAVRIGAKSIKTFDVEAERNSPQAYDCQLTVEPGAQRIAVAFLNDYYNPEAEDRRRRDRNLIVEHIELKGPRGFKPAKLPAAHERIFFVAPGDELSPQQAARQILLRFASRAYRRPATTDELNRLTGLFELAQRHDESFESSVQLAIQAVLVSPHFLFKVERPGYDDRDGEQKPLDDFELASNLSYFLWGSMPDDELFELARRRKLRDDGVLDKQVRRMLADPKASALVESFALQWLELRNLESVTPDEQRFPAFDERLRAAMLRETELFFAEIIKSDRSLLDLLAADFTFINEPLAELYGIKGVEGDSFRRVSLAGTQRGGLLTQASVLTVTSNPTRTSPVKRGKWVLENLLGEPPPPPAANVPELEDQKELTGTLRQMMEQHRADPRCATCHRRMDPLGFALENFDAIGGWRERDGKLPIDASGELPGGEKFRGARELQTLLLKTKKEAFVRCVAEKMLTYALGRGLEYYDQCAVDEITTALAENDYRFSTLILGIARSDPFQKRSTIRREK